MPNPAAHDARPPNPELRNEPSPNPEPPDEHNPNPEPPDRSDDAKSPLGLKRRRVSDARRRRAHRGSHRAHPPRRHRLLAATAITVAMLGVAGGVAAYQQTSAPASPRTAATRAVPPDDLADRTADRVARDGRPERRTGQIPSPNTTVKPAPPKPSPSRTQAPSRTRPPSPSRRPTPGWVRPTRGYDLTSGFGYRWGTMHEGVDLAAPTGTPIVAVRAGTIELAEWYGGYGYAVIVDHGNGIKTLYGHNSKLLVSKGQRVRTGQRISLMGSTGDSTGPHLHFEVHVNGDPVDPVPWMREHGVRL